MRDDALLRRILNYCTEIKEDRERFGDSLDDFLGDQSYQRSCCMNLMQIGETVNKLSYGFTEAHNEIDWISVIGFRNLVAHRYEDLDSVRIWEIIVEHVPKLKLICESILAESR